MASALKNRNSSDSNASAHDYYVDEITVQPHRRAESFGKKNVFKRSYYFNGDLELKSRQQRDMTPIYISRSADINSPSLAGSIDGTNKSLPASRKTRLLNYRPWRSQTALDSLHDDDEEWETQWPSDTGSKTLLTQQRTTDKTSRHSRRGKLVSDQHGSFEDLSEFSQDDFNRNKRMREMKVRRQRRVLQPRDDDELDARLANGERISMRLQPIAHHDNNFNSSRHSSLRQTGTQSAKKEEADEEISKQGNGLSSTFSCMYAILMICLYIVFAVAMTTSPSIPVYYYIGFPLLVILMSFVVLLMFYVSWIINAFKKKKRPQVIPEVEGRSWSPYRKSAAENQQIWPVIGKRPLHYALLWMGLCCAAGLSLNFAQFVFSTCLPLVLGLFYILAAIVIVLELPLLFNNNKMSEMSPRFLSKFCVLHLLVTNACIAIHQVVFGVDYFIRVRTFITLNGNCLACEPYDYVSVRHLAIRACEFKLSYAYELYTGDLYLLPQIIGYCLLACTLLIFVWKNLNSASVYYNEEEDRSVLWKSSTVGRKVFIGVLSIVVLLLTVAAITLFFAFTINKHSTLNFYIIRGYEICVHFVIVCIILIVSIRVRHLGTDVLKDSSIAEVILTFSLFGVFVYNLFYLIGCFHMSFLSPKYIVSVVNNILSVLTSCLQYSFLLRLSRRHVDTPEQVQNAPGYFGLSALLVFNISLYLINSSENHVNEFSAMQSEIYGNVVWALIQIFTIPLVLLFRLGCIFATGSVILNVYIVMSNRFSSPAVMTSF